MASQEFDYNITIGGQAGQGMQTLGNLLSRAFLNLGYSVSTYLSYESRIRGGHNYFQVRIASRPVHSMTRKIDLLIALDENTILQHCPSMTSDGLVIYDAETLKPADVCARQLGLEVIKISPETRQMEVLLNTLYLGVLTGVLNCPSEPVERTLRSIFAVKGQGIVDKNVAVFREGLDFIRNGGTWFNAFSAPAPPASGRYMPIQGNQAIALAAVAANCKFYAAYPMTPSTGILDAMAEFMESSGAVVEQAEDEIAALNMALGASYAGVRAMTGSSGGGFSLMVEALSLAGMIEPPVVIAVGQRPGPATGLPTRTQQTELQYVIHAGHGEFPRVVLAPGNVSECFTLTAHAFNLADRYQVPALILTDQYISDLYENTPKLIAGHVRVDRGKLAEAGADYLRYRFTPDGVSPRAFPGSGPGIVVADSDEHTEDGHLTEDLDVRKRMVEKRMAKNQGLIQEMIMPEIVGSGRDLGLVCWGSNLGVGKDAVTVLQSRGHRIALIHFKQLWPLDEPRIRGVLREFKRLVSFENNADGQLAQLLRGIAEIPKDNRILKYNGQPFFSDELIQRVERVIQTLGVMA